MMQPVLLFNGTRVLHESIIIYLLTLFTYCYNMHQLKYIYIYIYINSFKSILRIRHFT